MTETLANGYSSESTHQELSNEYQDDMVSIIFKKICILMLWTKVASALEGLITLEPNVNSQNVWNGVVGCVLFSILILNSFQIMNL